MILNRLLSFFLLVFISNQVFSQGTKVNGKVLDADTKTPMEYATVVVKSKIKGTSTDIKGNFSVEAEAGDILVFSFIGYRTKEFVIKQKSEFITIYLKEISNQLDETVVLPGKNPANTIMEKVADNRKTNNPENLQSFSYKTYNKFTIGANPKNDTTAFKAADSLKSLDDTLIYGMNLYLMESITEKKFKSPGKVSETVLASRMSGLKNAGYVLLGEQLQSFSFYNNYIRVLAKDYLSPTTGGNTSKYLFIIADTILQKGDSIFVIDYRPRRGKNFDGLTGKLYVDGKTYALHKAIAQPANQDTSITIRVEQYSEKIGDILFPVELRAEFNSKSLQMGLDDTVNRKKHKIFLGGYSYTRLSQIKLNEVISNKEFDNVILRYDKNATDKNNKYWNEFRYEPLSAKDSLTYKMIDSLGEEFKFDRRLAWFRVISSGKIPIKWFDLELSKIIRFNNFEGFRLGAGGETNQKLSEKFNIGAYYAYAFNSKLHNYGGNFKWNWNKTGSAFTNIFYAKDVWEIGGAQNYFYKLSADEKYRELYINRMDRVEHYGLTQSFRFLRYGKVALTAEHITRTNPTPSVPSPYLAYEYNYDRLRADFRYAPGEKLVQIFDDFKERKSRWPVFYLSTMYNFFNQQYSFDQAYFKTFAGIQYQVRFKNAGTSHFLVEGGITGVVDPLSEMFFARGMNAKGRGLRVRSENAFETMLINEFVSTDYVNIFWRHSFGSLLLRSKYFEPEIQVATNYGIGKSYARYLEQKMPGVRTMDKGFIESGLIVNNLFKANFTSLGAAVYYRYGHYAFANAKDNVVFKLSITSVLFR